jgi:hypothetical protein
MEDVKYYIYRGYEVTILCDGDKFACDIAEENGAGDFVDGFYDFDTLKDAEARAQEAIDEYTRYEEKVEPRPYRRFTSDPEEIEANHQWRIRAAEWGADRIDEFANVIKEEGN